ncbi:class F sortase [Streptomyces sp. SAJ15]|uniref:class F sortase n=1 Tax=Streptomyces sp. SAJ15 TaxID=2011095 RepID=UPI00118607AC|nr:class F sortase [Streptomyces sp. SAJ15]TVL90577.1 class F sortase [Streptomyces sp. SAJ15]
MARPDARPTPLGQGRVSRVLLTVGAILALVAGGWTLYHSSAPVVAVDAAPVRPAHPPLPRSPATAISIPAVSLEAPVVGLGLDRQGRLATPPMDAPRQAGWYERGASPGEPGTALMVGHRDTRTGPAVFLNLAQLRPGDEIDVDRADRRTAVFTVDAVRTYRKAEFPDARVYGHTDRPELRLLTCGGRFDPKTGYAANIVVFSHLTGVRPTADRS